jgi:hypothetical protein
MSVGVMKDEKLKLRDYTPRIHFVLISLFFVYFQQNKKGRRPKEKKKQCHTKTIKGKKSRYN